jgi:hypothetical protein
MLETQGSVSSPPSRADVPALSALVVIIFLFLVPMLLKFWPVSYCDGPVESIPRLLAIARILQQGGMPLWDFNTFAGARPFYVTNESGIFYPPMYPAYLAANVDDVDRATSVLMLLPFAFHLLWTAIGAYFFARLAIGLHAAGAFTTGLLWALSPEMAFQVFTPDVAYLFSYLPWILLAVARFLELGSVRWWAAATVFLALMNSAGTTNFVLRVYFVVAFVVVLLCAFSRTFPARRLAACAAMLALSVGMNGFAWAGVLEGVAWVQQAWPLTYDKAANAAAESSMPPLYVLTLFLPNFFGVMDNLHGWGIAIGEGITNLSAVGGGIFTITFAVIAAVYGCRRDGSVDSPRVVLWTRVTLVLLIVALLVMMGRYTPVFRVLCTLLPWFFRMPHAVYYRFAACWALAVLAGIGISLLWGRAADRQPYWATALACITTALLLAAIALLLKVELDGVIVTAYRTLTLYNEWNWFLNGPVATFVIASLALLTGLTIIRGRWRRVLAVAGVALEVVGFAYVFFYRAYLFEQVRPAPMHQVEMRDMRYQTLLGHPHYDLAPHLGELTRAEGVRFVGFDSRIDNQAWSVNARSLLGYSSKPVSPRFNAMMQRFTTGMPYQLEISALLPVFANMNVGFVANDQLDIIAVDQKIPADWQLVAHTHKLAIFRLPQPLPYVYTQDQVVALEDQGQLEKLLTSDLREAVYVSGEVAELLPERDGEEAGSVGFERLQQENPISRVVRGVNRLVIQVEVRTPAMLVINETWHAGWEARVDGEAVPLQQVNYLQQGLWLDAGKHEVSLTFFPTSLVYGAAMSGISASLFVVAIAFGGRRKPEDDGPNGAGDLA